MEQGGEFSLPERELTLSESCLKGLLDLREVQGERAAYDQVQQLAAVLYEKIPEDTCTLINVKSHNQDNPVNFAVSAEEVIASVSIQFDSYDPESLLGIYHVDVIRTGEGPKLFWVKPQLQDNCILRSPIRELTEIELNVLRQDTEITRSNIVDRAAERLKLGELVEDACEDGTRRFHLGDVTSVFTGWSPRDVDGIVDFLRYLTGEVPSTTQIYRFMQECQPHVLAHHGESLAPFMEQLQDGGLDTLHLYRLIGQIAQATGPFLEVPPLDPSQHAVLDPIDEIILDFGPDVK